MSSSGAFIQWSMLLWLLPSECLPFRMKLMTCIDLRGPTCLWLCSLGLHHRSRYLFRNCPGTFVKTRFHGVMSSNGLCDQHYFFLSDSWWIVCAIYDFLHHLFIAPSTLPFMSEEVRKLVCSWTLVFQELKQSTL